MFHDDTARGHGRRIWHLGRRGLFAGGLALALAGAAPITAHAHGPMGMGGAPDLESAQEAAALRAKQMLRRVDATAEQQTKVKAIIEAAVRDTYPLREKRREAHTQLMKLMAAPSIDRAAVERLRAEQVDLHARASQRMMTAMIEAAEVLTPAQREKLAKDMGERHGRGAL